MARLRTTTSKNIKYHSIIEDYYRNGKRTTKNLVTLGNDEKISKIAAKENMDINTWLNNYLENYKKEHAITTPKEEIIIKKYTNVLIPKNKIS